MNSSPLRYSPTLDTVEILTRLSLLLAGGDVTDGDLERRVARIDERFKVYARTFPCGIWAPGLVVSAETKRLTETYLPMADIRRAFHRLFTLVFRLRPVPVAAILDTSGSWLDFLSGVVPEFRRANPADLLAAVMADEALRRSFLFSMFLPGQHGGSFGRYPQQAASVRSWLRQHGPSPVGQFQVLDAACGTGEGTYELALLLVEEGIAEENMAVHGATLEPLELFAAAHCLFPHDPEREAAFRRRVRPLLDAGLARRISFFQDDVMLPRAECDDRYRVIVCNGLLGGPRMHGPGKMAEVVRQLARRLRPGGVLFAADRFHDGWHRRVAKKTLEELLVGAGLRPIMVAEGVAGEK